MFFKGFRFGLLLQVAVGPVCLYVLTTAIRAGFADAFLSVLAVTIVDALFIVLALLGAVSILNRKGSRFLVRIAGGSILILFGANLILDFRGLGFLPGVGIRGGEGSSFAYAFLLTLSNPMTILFWVGVFGGRMAEKGYGEKDLKAFALGCVGSTLAFLTAVSAAGALLGKYIPDIAIRSTNGIIGLVLLYFGIRLMIRKPSPGRGGPDVPPGFGPR
jgi:threonine/homoserine/homoserine lactone efflux protein